MKKYYVILLIFYSLLIMACTPTNEVDNQSFLSKNSLGIYQNSEVVYVYNEFEDQLSTIVANDYFSFRMQNELNSFAYSIAKLPKNPVVGERYPVEVIFIGSPMEVRSNLDAEVMKMNEDLVWLYSSEKNIGFIVNNIK